MVTKSEKYPDHLFVRIHPYNPQRGHLTKRYFHGETLYREDRGWKKVSRTLGEELTQILTHPNDPNSAPIFGVYEYEEAREIEFQENYEADPRRRIEDAAQEELEGAPEVEKKTTVRKKKSATKKKSRTTRRRKTTPKK